MGQAALANRNFDSATVALRLREELARRRISREGLAQTARLSMSTLEKAMSGRRPFTLATVVRLEDALGASLREEHGTPAPPPADSAIPGLAPEHMGAYARPAVRWIEQSYLTLRPGFEQREAIYAYRTRIAWCEEAGHLVFTESARLDRAYEQRGFVSMPCLSGHIYLVTNVAGQFRMAVLGLAAHSQRLYGLLTTLKAGAGSQLLPVSCPIALVPEQQIEGIAPGVLLPPDAAYAQARAVLDTATTSDFARLIG
ncbi:MAG: helix-turn-helix transcriptional regulator [Erythrobacter sp.]|nr:helix-turn-helix transcriptional regulator [Erythrobacter sp.]